MIDIGLGPARCPLCLGACDGALCEACEQALPWNTPACPCCALPQNHDALCADCARDPPPQDHAWAALRWATPTRESIHALKYHAGFLQADWLGAVMARRLQQRDGPLPQLLIPVPLHWRRLMRRGYNQTQELARALSQRLRLPLHPELARRKKATPDQIGLRLAQRHKNMQSAFEVSDAVAGRHIALLDDVITTGATLRELARTAREAGATKIEVWAAARA